MDSDDISKPTRFEHQLKVLSENPEVAVVGSWVEEFSKNPEIVDGVRGVPEHDDEIKRYAKSRNPVNQPSVVFRKSAVMGVGNYRNLYLYEDYDLWVRLILNGARFYNIPRCLVSQRNGAGLYARRGGWNYAIKEMKFLYGFHKMGLYGFPFFLRNVFIRTSVRLIPTGTRAFFYKSFLRR
jgi:GT2 family glycosyltransferase